MPYVLVEGVDGAGKTSLARTIVDRLMASGRQAIYVTEPSKTPGTIGAEIRRRAAEGPILEPWEALGLFVADRRRQDELLVRPALSQGTWVVKDRGWLSSAVYQGDWEQPRPPAWRDYPTLPSGEWIAHEHIRFCPPPDLLVLLDLPAPAAVDRIASRPGRRTDQFDQAGVDEIANRRSRYLRLVNQHVGAAWWGRALVLDASRPAAQVTEEAWQAVLDLAAPSKETQ